jgi:hypothetical protein
MWFERGQSDATHLEDIQADSSAVDVHVRMIAGCVEFDSWRHVRII